LHSPGIHTKGAKVTVRVVRVFAVMVIVVGLPVAQVPVPVNDTPTLHLIRELRAADSEICMLNA
jgi:hypothetical protein